MQGSIHFPLRQQNSVLLSSSSLGLLHGKRWQRPVPRSYQLLPTLYPLSSKEVLCFLIQTPLQEIHIAGVERREQVSIRKTETFNENGLQGHPDYQLFWCVMVEKKWMLNCRWPCTDASCCPCEKWAILYEQDFVHKLACVILYITLKREKEMKWMRLLYTEAAWNVKCTTSVSKRWWVLP